MANKKISELVETTALNDADVLPVVQGNATKKIQYSNIKNDIRNVGVDKYTPSNSNKKEVWFKNGKNLLDERNLITGVYTIGAGTYSDSADSRCTKNMIEIDNTQNYVLSLNSNNNSAYMYVMYYNSSKSYLGYTSTYLRNPLSLNTYANYSQAKYINIRFDTQNVVEPMLEQGNTKTTYERYIADIYVKNDNVYREFNHVENEVYSAIETQIGTWIDRKTFI